jgi:hypothetical protein
MRESMIKFSADDLAVGVAQLVRYEQGSGLGTYRQHFAAYLALAIQMERILYLKAFVTPEGAPDVTGWMPSHINHPDRAKYAKDVGLGPWYLAVRHALRLTYRNQRRVTTLTNGQQLTGWPLAVGIIVVGIASAAGATWWGVDKNEKEAEVEKFRLSAALTHSLRDLEARVATGQPLPDPPKAISEAAAAEEAFPWWGIGAGVVIGGGAAYGIMRGLRRPVRRANPRRRMVAPRRRRRAQPPAARRARKAAAKRTVTKKRRVTKKRVTKKRAKVKRPAPNPRKAKARTKRPTKKARVRRAPKRVPKRSPKARTKRPAKARVRRPAKRPRRAGKKAPARRATRKSAGR